mmetsp:Transcript_124123/g.396968  ORF Transcript_124123/g.396968 Transcript_124123/m.396968 type:complete len:87 (-) Transcript_124123:27-287(-)
MNRQAFGSLRAAFPWMQQWRPRLKVPGLSRSKLDVIVAMLLCSLHGQLALRRQMRSWAEAMQCVSGCDGGTSTSVGVTVAAAQWCS